MHPLHRIWWQLLMELQQPLRFWAARLPRLTPWGVRFRAVLHWMVGNPIQILATVDGVVVWSLLGLPLRWLLVTLVVVHIAVVVGHRIVFDRGGCLVGWHEAWRLRRRWPTVWAMVAAKTARVQAEVGTSSEPIAPAVLRPVADHPKLSWLPSIQWPVVSWWIGPPPGRSLVALDELADVLAANFPRVVDVTVDYERANDSHGRLIVSFGDITGRVTSPPWHQATDSPNVIGIGGTDNLDDAIAAFDAEPGNTFPPLRVVGNDEEAS